MKYLNFFACSALVLLTTCAPSMAQQTATIDAQVEQIEARLAQDQIEENEPANFSDQGGTLTDYKNDDTLDKRSVTYYSETSQSTVDFYYWDQALIFAERNTLTYKSSIYDENFNMDDATQATEHFYFANNALFQWIGTDGQAKDLNDPEVQVTIEDLLQEAN